MKNPFDSGPSNADIEHQRNLVRWSRMDPQLARVLPTQEREVQQLMGKEIQREWELKARNSGQLFAEEIPDPQTGRVSVKYHGDIAEAFRPFKLPPIPFQLSKIVHHQGRPYLAHQLPPAIQRERALMAIGDRDWQ